MLSLHHNILQYNRLHIIKSHGYYEHCNTLHFIFMRFYTHLHLSFCSPPFSLNSDCTLFLSFTVKLTLWHLNRHLTYSYIPICSLLNFSLHSPCTHTSHHMCTLDPSYHTQWINSQTVHVSGSTDLHSADVTLVCITCLCDHISCWYADNSCSSDKPQSIWGYIPSKPPSELYNP